MSRHEEIEEEDEDSDSETRRQEELLREKRKNIYMNNKNATEIIEN
jgi:hypothetical protein